MLNKKSINMINAHIRNFLNYATAKIDLAGGIENVQKVDIDIIELNACAIEEDLEMAYINNQLDKISFYNVLYWQKILDLLERVEYPYTTLLRAGVKQLLKANGFKSSDIEELFSRH
jgi:hypothetical protein